VDEGYEARDRFQVNLPATRKGRACVILQRMDRTARAIGAVAACALLLVSCDDSKAASVSTRGGHFAPNLAVLASPAPRPETTALRGFPAIGPWMLKADLEPADWLGASYEGKRLREPINIIVRDRRSTSPGEAVKSLVAACEKAGFESVYGHSSGYIAFLGGEYYSQLPAERHRAFADGPPELDNDHGRFFGPYRAAGAYWFIGSFSYEIIHPVSKVPHAYRSFNRARDRLADRLEHKGGYRVAGYAPLGNVVLYSTGLPFFTGDHDGMAAILEPGP